MEPSQSQQEELQVLKSIFSAEDFLPPPKGNAWKVKGPPEFMLRIRHPVEDCAESIQFCLHVIFTQTYPINPPVLKVQKPIFGLTEDHVAILQNLVIMSAKERVGSAMIYDIYDICLDWLRENIKPPKQSLSLAGEMSYRAAQEQEALQLEREAAAYQRRQEEERQREELRAQLNLDSLKKKESQRVERQKARKRGLSNAPEIVQTVEVPIEVFNEKIKIRSWDHGEEYEFDSVMTFSPCIECFGTTWQAEPLCDAPRGLLRLELHVVTLDAHYYGSAKGRKKLEEIESDLRTQIRINHPNLQALYAVKLLLGQPAKMAILMERRPNMTLYDLLQTRTGLSTQTAADWLRQCISALSSLHKHGVVHKGITVDCIGLSALKGRAIHGIKLGRASWYATFVDLHKSNPFGDFGPPEEDLIPTTWLPQEVLDAPLSYTPTRDISQLGIIFIQIVLGANAVVRYSDPFTAVNSSDFPDSFRDLTIAMLEAGERRPTSCVTLLNSWLNPNEPTNRRNTDVTIAPPSTLGQHGRSWPSRSPEIETVSFAYRPHHSRWREDWEELELLGAGGFGRVVKARNRLDGRIYAVKKIKLRQDTSDDDKIFREVKLLSRLSHRHIVRYYTTWLEIPEASLSEFNSSHEDSSDAGSEETSRQPTSEDDLLTFDLDDLTARSQSQSTSFPSIHFSRENSKRLISMDDQESASEDETDSMSPVSTKVSENKLSATSHRVLYIQMEFVERQTLNERIAEGLSEEEAWRLFHQLLEALVHMSNLQILHRDIKCSNIFIDKHGDIKVGDFGLATSSLAAVLPSDKPTPDATLQSKREDMTLDIGTRLYTAPEVLGSGTRRNHDHTKADMYSLGIVFFEMNFPFSTQSERVAVLEELRKPEVVFPDTWQGRSQQKQIIASLLQHDIAARPTAQQLSKSDLLPPKVHDEYFRNALHVMTQRGSMHYGEILNSLFDQPPRAAALAYDRDLSVPGYAPLLPVIQNHLADIFRLHGAVDSTPPSLLPKVEGEDYGPNTMFLLDRQGEVLSLPRNILVPMARRAAHSKIRRIKRFHIGDVYSTGPGGGHPIPRRAAFVDIITPDLTMGAQPAMAELLGVADQCLRTFPGSDLDDYVIYITHTDVKECIYNRIPATRLSSVQEILSQPKSSWRTKRGFLVKANVPKTTLDELEALSEPDDLELLMANISRLSQTLHTTLSPLVDEIRQIIRCARIIGVPRTIKFRPLMESRSFHAGVWFQFVRSSKRAELIAAGGRYDHLLRKFSEPTVKADAVRAFGLQIDVERIAMHLAAYQSISVGKLITEKRSFGVFSPRRCDVYIYSFQAGHLAERLEVAALLWKHKISCDIMYDAALQLDEEDHLKQCVDEGILFTVYPKPPTARTDQPAFKVKSVLRDTETGVSRHELVPFLLSAIAEQRKVDMSTSTSTGAPPLIVTKDPVPNDDVQLVLLQDANRKLKKPPKGVKDALNPAKEKASDLAYGFGDSLRQASLHGLPIVAVDIPALAFNVMINEASAGWLVNEDAWKAVLAAMPQIPSARAIAIKEAVARKKEEGKKHVLLFHVHDERAFLFTFA